MAARAASFFRAQGLSHNQRGLTLVEMMVSVAIGLLVVGAVLYVYMGSRGAYRISKSTSRVQEAGRFGMDAIMHDVREAGFIGCGSRMSLATYQAMAINQVAVPPMTLASGAQAIGGYSASSYAPGSTNPWPQPNGISPPWLSGGGDVLVLRVATASPVMMVADSNTATPAIYVGDNCAGVTTGDYVLASNCTSAAMLRVSNAPATPAAACTGTGAPVPGGVEIDFAPTDVNGNPVNTNAGPAPSFSYSTLPSAQRFDEYTYYVGQMPFRQWPALYRYSLRAGAAEEIIDHVQAMSVYYGVDPGGGGAVQYQSAAQVQAANGGAGNWANVTSVRVQLLAAGDDQGVADLPRPALAFGPPNTPPAFVPPDTRYWQLFTATAALRNRLQ
ncbi:MAG TPA: PilW family protein [Burkholderiaceae bacterium]|nr:PilW family protein [Burkholderiaceae bacterium]